MLLRIVHVGYTDDGKPKFGVRNIENSTHGPAVVLLSPEEVQVAHHNINLRDGLKWYLEEYLDIAEGPYRKKADDVCKALDRWGEECFETLFGNGQAQDWYLDAIRDGLINLSIKIISDDPKILSWPWEVLKSHDEGYLALHCDIERQLSNISESVCQHKMESIKQLNILYIIARPYGVEDVDYRILAKPFIDFLQEQKLPVYIDVLRPPTFDRLLDVLNEKPGFYHIVHFDGHGGYGVLFFEKDTSQSEPNHSYDLINAEKLGKIFREYNIPVMVLNACRSAMLDEQAEGPFASVATSLLKAGIRSVVAMSYSLYVSGAREFMPVFYKKLFESGNVAISLCAGRQEMFKNNKRICFTGLESLHDWIVPVLYQQHTSVEGVLPQLLPRTVQDRSNVLPPEVISLDTYGFIGRDEEILSLEKAFRQPQGGILIHGMAGEGKTTLVKGFLQWLEVTHGLGEGVFWFSFEDIRSAGFVLDTIENALYGKQVIALSMEDRINRLIKTFREKPFILIWDNFESASGIPAIEVSALIPEEDRQLLKRLIHDLYNCKTKVLITSRSTESWLTTDECFRVTLGGLRGEELWAYCNTIVEYLGLTLNRDDAYRELMNKLEGNPLAVRLILSRLNKKSTAELLDELEESFIKLEGDKGATRIEAVLAVFEKGLDRHFAPLLRFLGLHEHFVDIEYIGEMLLSLHQEEVDIFSCFAALEKAGICRPMGNDVYQIHPIFRSYISQLYPAYEEERKAFVKVMGRLALLYNPKKLYLQRVLFMLNGANHYQALRLARQLDMRFEVMSLLNGLATYARCTWFFTEAERLYKELAETAKAYNEPMGEAFTYHELGIISQDRRDFNAAECFYRKSLAITLRQGYENVAAQTYYQLGTIALERKDFDTAEDWYRKSLAIELKLKNEEGAANVYGQLGTIAQERKDFDVAEELYIKGLTTEMKQDDELKIAITYHQLGMSAQEHRDFDTAEDWYRKSLDIKLKLDDEHEVSITYHQLGMVAQDRGDFDTAEDWYRRALIIELKLGDEHGTAYAYHQLGMVAQERKDLDEAEDWYRKSLDIKLKQNDEYGIALTYHQLGMLAQERENLDEAEDWYRKALAIELKQNNERNAACTYNQLGMVAQGRKNYDEAEDWYRKALDIFESLGDVYRAKVIRHNLSVIRNIK